MTTQGISVLRDIKARVERAEGPDREIDRAIFHGLLGQPRPRTGFQINMGAVLRYSASLDAATALVEKLTPGLDWYVNRDGSHVADVAYFADVWNGAEREMRIDIMHNTPAMTLLSALLSALIAKAEHAQASPVSETVAISQSEDRT